MPFTAEGKNGNDTWEHIDITKYRSPKVALANYELRCADPDCHAPMFVKHGLQTAPHFAHVANHSAPGCIFGGGGESEYHRLAKLTVAEKLRTNSHYADADIQLERIVYAGGKKRIVDVFVEFPDGLQEAHEVQLARTNIAECQERTNDYYLSGVASVVWWFGGDNALDASLKQWAEQETGISGDLDFESVRVRI